MTTAVGGNVWLLSKNLRTSRSAKTLDYKSTKSYMATEIIYKNADKVDLSYTMHNHNILHVSLLDCYTQPVGGQSSSEPHPVFVEKPVKWEVKCILDSR